MYKEYHRKVIIFIDEYDVPLQKALLAKDPYYDQMLDIIRAIFSQTFKPGRVEWLYTGIVTGCLKIAHQSIFTGANNFMLYGLDEKAYAGFFGFTRSETEKLLQDCELSAHNETMKKWYDGYRIGDEHLFCPWSVVKFCDKALKELNNVQNMEPEPFWINTSGNDVINLYLERAINDNLSEEIKKMEDLLNNVPQQIIVKDFVTYPDISNIGVDFDTCMTLLLQTGYLTFTDDSALTRKVFLKIPNREIFECFAQKLEMLYSGSNPVWFSRGVQLLSSLLSNDTNNIWTIINQFLTNFISIRNTGSEFYYHGFILGILTMVASRKNVELKSEQETGNGYSDIIISQQSSGTIVILELKKTENDDAKRMSAAKNAVEQILDKKYVDAFDKSVYTKIYGIGVGLGGKACAVKSAGNLR